MTALLLIRRFWWTIPIALLFALWMRADNLRAHYKKSWQAVTTEYAVFRTVIIDKTAEAMAKDRANVRRVAGEQNAINERKARDIETRLGSTAARYNRLRDKANKGGFGDPAVPVLPDATCKAYVGADCDGVLAKLKAAEDQTAQLIELQDWVSEQAAVNVTGEQ
ncbi:hypothetical protein [Sphingobium sp. BS19]|uniref:hypothetical protein n=1 Tax=Sphingobium sp. BS19 TaxID=3018973 RepID=UPI0022EDA739|nr:hypothetical protein [Sphingobium sp. BS19]GLI99106.1 hypothetical protein Sbs19_29240 [Sphingobium sp. BS19]